MAQETRPAHDPLSRRKRRAGLAIMGVILGTIVVIFVLRQVWHADQVQEDPASQTAPDGP